MWFLFSLKFDVVIKFIKFFFLDHFEFYFLLKSVLKLKNRLSIHL